MPEAPRLFLVSFDEVCVLWDAIRSHRRILADDPGNYYLEVALSLQERIGDLMAVEYSRRTNK